WPGDTKNSGTGTPARFKDVPPSVRGSGGAASLCEISDARLTPYSEAMLTGASTLPPVGFAALTKASGFETGAGPIENPIGLERPAPRELTNTATTALPIRAMSLPGIKAVKCVLSTKV